MGVGKKNLTAARKYNSKIHTQTPCPQTRARQMTNLNGPFGVVRDPYFELRKMSNSVPSIGKASSLQMTQCDFLVTSIPSVKLVNV